MTKKAKCKWSKIGGGMKGIRGNLSGWILDRAKQYIVFSFGLFYYVL